MNFSLYWFLFFGRRVLRNTNKATLPHCIHLNVHLPADYCDYKIRGSDFIVCVHGLIMSRFLTFRNESKKGRLSKIGWSWIYLSLTSFLQFTCFWFLWNLCCRWQSEFVRFAKIRFCLDTTSRPTYSMQKNIHCISITHKKHYTSLFPYMKL